MGLGIGAGKTSSTFFMNENADSGDIKAIIIKDMSRLGRDYLKVGQVMEILRQRGVRLIAINDGVDSANGENDFTPFLNIMYEFYARDTNTFANDNGQNPVMEKAYAYVEHRKEAYWDNTGLLFFGDVGTGKSRLYCQCPA